MQKSIKPEVLSPAGSMESLIAAVRSGADAVYLGAKDFNARRNADNFDNEQLKSAAKYCRIRGVKTYLTLNIMLKQNELEAALNLVKYAYEIGINGIIISDLGLARLVKQYVPQIELHASTQMSLHSPSALKVLKCMGFTRVVAGREMSKEQLTVFCKAAKELNMQVEMFVHGALCMSVSGQCLLSAAIGGRSGNRGLCAGPCRLPFKATGGNGYDLSLKDLSLIQRIDELKEIGIDSLKIEGRMKRPEYIAAATAACRQAVDSGYAERNLYDTLSKVFSRSGFTGGYFDNKKGPDMFGIRTEDDAAVSKETYSLIHEYYRNERQSVGVDISAEILKGREMKLCFCDGENTVTVSGDKPQTAKNKGAQKEDIEKSLSKLGGTPYFAKSVSVKLDEGLFVPNSAINALRRDAVEMLSEKRAQINTQKTGDISLKINRSKSTHGNMKLVARFSGSDKIPQNLSGISGIIVPCECDIPKNIPENIKLIADAPRIIYNEEKLFERLAYLKQSGFTAAFCGNLSAAVLADRAGLKVIAAPGLNICNGESIKALKNFNASAVTLSLETDISDVSSVDSDIPKGIVAYGNIPLMLLANCPVKNGIGCARCDGRKYLTDRKGTLFPVRCRNKEYSELLNSVPLYLADRLNEINTLDFAILYFTDESVEDTERIIGEYISGGTPPKDFTRGMYYRRIL